MINTGYYPGPGFYFWQFHGYLLHYLKQLKKAGYDTQTLRGPLDTGSEMTLTPGGGIMVPHQYEDTEEPGNE